MAEEQLVELIQNQLNTDVEVSARRDREIKTALKGNKVFSENVGKPVFEYLDTIYFQRIVDYVIETYEERIKQLENRVTALETGTD